MNSTKAETVTGYIVLKLDPYLDQSVSDEEMDKVFEVLLAQVPRILEMSEEELTAFRAELLEETWT